jgi:hypothetical protein
MKVLQPVLAAESAIVLGGSVVNVINGKGSATSRSINLNP